MTPSNTHLGNASGISPEPLEKTPAFSGNQAAPLDALQLMANGLRLLSIDAIEAAGSGHPGLPLGMADVATVLWAQFLKFNPQDPRWPDRDRFILSAGHGSMLLYGLLHLSGFDLSLNDLKNFRQLHSRTPGHPEYGHTPGVETTTGPLGQGFANGVGMALAEALLRQEFGKDLQSHHTYVLASDGCLMEGISSEAASFAGHYGLGRLIVLFDDNGITIDGPTHLSTSDDHTQRFEAMGWEVLSIDGHNMAQIQQAILNAKINENKPTLIRCRTTIGYGSPHKAGTEKVHGSPLGAEEAALTRKALGYEKAGPFDVGDYVKNLWSGAWKKNQHAFSLWQERCKAHPEKAQALLGRLKRKGPENWQQKLTEQMKKKGTPQSEATRASLGNVLEILHTILPGLLGGSADLTPSNNTKASVMKALTPHTFEGNYIHFGIREHLMGAALNGLVLHGGFWPYGGTFLVFSDYMRPAIRLAALMNIPSVFVLTHDSIGLGEDGPTHQPIEHLWSLRHIPNLQVFRPSNAAEVSECWILALESKHPSALILSRQKVPALRMEGPMYPSPSSKGAYILKEAKSCTSNKNQDAPHIAFALWATGSEVSLAMEVAAILEKAGYPARVISAPCLELFQKQPLAYQDSLLKPGQIKASIEAGATGGWHAYIGSDGVAMGIDHFGASAKADQLFKAFGLDAATLSGQLIDRAQKGGAST